MQSHNHGYPRFTKPLPPFVEFRRIRMTQTIKKSSLLNFISELALQRTIDRRLQAESLRQVEILQTSFNEGDG